MEQVKNVIFIMLDTLQFNYLGCYGNKTVQTPNLDRFARQGWVFENAYSEGLPTVPVRRALMTGRYTLPHGGWKPLSAEDTTLTDLLWTRPVQTALVYSTPPMRLPKYGYSRGFDYVKFCNGHELDHETFSHVPLDPAIKAEDYVGNSMLAQFPEGKYDDNTNAFLREIECYLKQRQNWKDDSSSYAATVVQEADDWLRVKRDKERPFMLWIDSFDPHEPWDAPSMWENRPCPYDPNYKGKHTLLVPFSEVEGVYTDEECAHIRALYAEKITNTDKWVGKLLASLKEQGLWENTMVVITSDHGQPMGKGEHGHGIMRKCRPWPYEELVHIPLLMHVPGLEGGKRISGFVQNVDITATMVDALGYLNESARTQGGVEGLRPFVMHDMHGKSLLPLLRGEVEKVREAVLAGYFGMSWSIITEDYSYIHWLRNSVDTDFMLAVFYDACGLDGGNAGERTAELEVGEEKWTCVPGLNVTVPEQDELYCRKTDQFQLNNIIGEKPEVAAELLQKLKQTIGTLRTS